MPPARTDQAAPPAAPVLFSTPPSCTLPPAEASSVPALSDAAASARIVSDEPGAVADVVPEASSSNPPETRLARPPAETSTRADAVAVPDPAPVVGTALALPPRICRLPSAEISIPLPAARLASASARAEAVPAAAQEPEALAKPACRLTAFPTPMFTEVPAVIAAPANALAWALVAPLPASAFAVPAATLKLLPTLVTPIAWPAASSAFAEPMATQEPEQLRVALPRACPPDTARLPVTVATWIFCVALNAALALALAVSTTGVEPVDTECDA